MTKQRKPTPTRPCVCLVVLAGRVIGAPRQPCVTQATNSSDGPTASRHFPQLALWVPEEASGVTGGALAGPCGSGNGSLERDLQESKGAPGA